MRVDAFDFHLPEERIALRPSADRDGAKLLHVRGDAIGDHAFRDIAEHFTPGDILVLNKTRVIPAQLKGRRAARAVGGGGDVMIDVTLHKKRDDDAQNSVWDAFVRPAKRLQIGDEIAFGEGFAASVEHRDGAEARLRFCVGGAAFNAALARFGAPPLPPYVARKRSTDDDDSIRYQTVFAEDDGSVAAPTAGLHFTPAIFEALESRGVLCEKITLHVGAGTFLPVTVDDTDDHEMHAEWGEITSAQADRINNAKRAGGRVIAVGTTSLRLLESAAGAGGDVGSFESETDIFITPGYRFKVVDALITNFHLPRSTLFMLVCAFAGTDAMKAAYAHAIEHNYRFYSYGDASLLERATK